MPKFVECIHSSTTSQKMTYEVELRRSTRRSLAALEREHRQLIYRRLSADNDNECHVGVKMFPEKGRGVVALRDFEKGQFVLEYAGELINIARAKERERKYSLDPSTGCYMYYFNYNDLNYCIDATKQSNRPSRLVNHSRIQPNLQTKLITFQGQPRLILLARVKIKRGSELLFDYGDRSKSSIAAHPWLAQ
ncbi:hypothetical protein TCAL_09968 [Tigriopus californicus]|uniref:SET domain-containing protein n=1 Tax=Tigriopus californicus TaxID=6832 RepID=A0A553P3I3_TIGCA|nr:N-lysine methyltransferase KMT5A-A-like [Tigriopus californicus]TRY72239.1 hypothetical protein TCAL_09968 [Tigriopus californicus]|eukprot:TCALIF_09968-PA protein Name:"Similar to setd8a N-lysine methyltransferase SETD8-A (Danio rerio)" AED:0.03 eAED:0.03 QI:0/-1/0/1/-1/1/1/0/191